MTRISVFVAIALTLLVHHLLVRRAAAAGRPRLPIGGKIRRWFDAAAIAVLGTILLLGGIHLLGLATRGHA